MQTTRPLGIYRAAPVVRWGARLLSVPILLFGGWFLIAHLLGDEATRQTLLGRPSRPGDTVVLWGVVLSLVGLAVAWKWELLGGTMTLAALATAAFFNWSLLTGPYGLIAVAAAMFLTCGWMRC